MLHCQRVMFSSDPRHKPKAVGHCFHLATDIRKLKNILKL